MKYYPYERFKDDTNFLIKKLKDYDAQVIVGIARGGLSLAHAMAEGLGIRNVQTVRTELYDEDIKREKIRLFGGCSFAANTKVIVVDDISDSGETLDAIMKDLKKKHPSVKFVTATLFYKNTSKFKPDYWVNNADEWIDYFWEKDFGNQD